MGRPESLFDGSDLSGGIRTEMGGQPSGGMVPDKLSGRDDALFRVGRVFDAALKIGFRAFRRIISLPARLEEDVIRGTLTDD